jgi:hypothetical protein
MVEKCQAGKPAVRCSCSSRRRTAPGGRLALAAWRPDGSVAKFLSVIARHSYAPPAAASPHTEHIWHKYAEGFGPIRQLVAGMSPERRAALRSDVDGHHRQYETKVGLHVRREYLIILGTRR